MSEEAVHSIWRPSVKLTSSSSNNTQEAPHFTKTSLRHCAVGDPVDEYNARVREACQAHNNTARPFERQPEVAITTTSHLSPTLHQEPVSFKLDRESSSSQTNYKLSSSSSSQHKPQGPAASMSSKLVHKQYNSPLEMYSMNNIRQTIEAQSELLAPGVKGINFMKSESPVNKQSEVYKLIKEEEEEKERRRQQQQQQQQQVGAGLDHQQGRNVSSSSSHNFNARQTQDLTQQQHHEERIVQFASERNLGSAASSHQSRQSSGSSNQLAARNERSLAETIQQSIGSGSNVCMRQPTLASSSLIDDKQPKCCECGQLILGPFAKIQDRFVHPHCFNCSTCGSSLKNSGYFTINDKLYCDIHARQVANVMRLNYNFEPNKQTIDNTRQQYDDEVTRRQQQQVVVRHQTASNQQVGEKISGHQQAHLSTGRDDTLTKQQNESNQRCANCCVTLGNQSATISTMFSNKLGSNGCTCNRSGEIRMIWRPCQAGAQQKQAGGSALASSSSNVATNLHYQQQSQSQMMRNKHQSQMVTNSSAVSGSQGGITPVCCHCRLQIHGPYILAGKTIWCKPCSQTHFACSACHRSLLNVGFIEDSQVPNKYYCEHCFGVYLAPVCAKCHIRIKDQDCLKALGKTWHTNCFVCTHCKCQFGNSSFYLEDDLPYCERDWNLLFTTKCFNCAYPIEAGDKWVEALERNYHSDCFRCAGCQVKLEGSTFYCKGGKPYCRMHAR